MLLTEFKNWVLIGMTLQLVLLLHAFIGCSSMFMVYHLAISVISLTITKILLSYFVPEHFGAVDGTPSEHEFLMQ
jgi:hypothetical protein